MRWLAGAFISSSTLHPAFYGGGLLLYVMNLIVVIAYRLIRSMHSIAHGIATMVFIAPTVGVVGCSWFGGAVPTE